MTLGKFLKKYEKNLGGTKGHWKVIISGKLSFNQDLIYSRILNTSYQQRKYSSQDPDNPTSRNLSRPFVLLKSKATLSYD